MKGNPVKYSAHSFISADRRDKYITIYKVQKLCCLSCTAISFHLCCSVTSHTSTPEKIVASQYRLQYGCVYG